MERFKLFSLKVSKNNTRQCWILKCDVRKFFASIDHEILVQIMEKHIQNGEVGWLLKEIIRSFEISPGKGLPLGNLTSQLLVNVYMNEFDHFVKHQLKTKYYIRYADDFIFLSSNKDELKSLLPRIDLFLNQELKITLHQDKVFIKTLASGLDFLGWVHFPEHRVLRTVTRKRMMKRMMKRPSLESKASYKGMLIHGNSYKLRKIVDGIISE